MFRASSAHLQEGIVVYKQHMVPSLSIRVLVACWYAAIGRTSFIPPDMPSNNKSYWYCFTAKSANSWNKYSDVTAFGLSINSSCATFDFVQSSNYPFQIAQIVLLLSNRQEQFCSPYSCVSTGHQDCYREWRCHMLLIYNYVLLKMITWCSKHVEESSILRINNSQCIKLVINV